MNQSNELFTLSLSSDVNEAGLMTMKIHHRNDDEPRVLHLAPAEVLREVDGMIKRLRQVAAELPDGVTIKNQLLAQRHRIVDIVNAAEQKALLQRAARSGGGNDNGPAAA